eukprot:TRINITY_DN13741_c0_g1_i1.p2 TRINITY_DN13741_c0_g1~~TRINITY_DN13741_c0_g1_i1.p2  ORF type:complete len:368 (+),score=75.93 TRINITY_DN13741_c0_g1_i1:94-1197(+)
MVRANVAARVPRQRQPRYVAAGCLLAGFTALQGFSSRGFVALRSIGDQGAGGIGALRASTPPRQTRVVLAAEGDAEGDVTYKVGDTVEAVFPDDGEWYPGVVEKDNGDGTFEIKWDDPDGGPESSPCKTDEMNKIVPKIPLEKLTPGEKMKGTVTNVMDFGAFVDIGAVREGLVHVSKQPQPEVKSGPFAEGDYVEAVFPDDGEYYTATVTKVTKDAVEVKWDDPDGGPETSECKPDEVKHAASGGLESGQEVEVWIDRVVQREDGDRLQLSMLPPPDLMRFASLHPSEWLKGTITGVQKFGFFVRVTHPDGGAPEQGLVHVSQIKAGFVDDPWAEGEEGQEIQVRVVDVDEDRGRLALSMVDEGIY